MEEQEQIMRIGIKIPTFIPEDPELWFMQMEAQFSIAGIKQDSTKYAHMLAGLDAILLKEVGDLLRNPPASDAYEKLKREIIRRFSISEGHRLRQVLSKEELGDQKPSQFARHLTNLAGSAVPGNVVRVIWLERLLQQIQAILAGHSDMEFTKLADLADKIYGTLQGSSRDAL